MIYWLLPLLHYLNHPLLLPCYSSLLLGIVPLLYKVKLPCNNQGMNSSDFIHQGHNLNNLGGDCINFWCQCCGLILANLLVLVYYWPTDFYSPLYIIGGYSFVGNSLSSASPQNFTRISIFYSFILPFFWNLHFFPKRLFLFYLFLELLLCPK